MPRFKLAGGGDAEVWSKRTETGAKSFTDHEYHQNNVINVKTYFGAKGDGTTDDTAAIQAAIDAAEAGMANSSSVWGAEGASVYFPSGTYLISSSVTITSNAITIQGDASRGPILLCTADTLTMFVVGDTSLTDFTHDVRFRDVYFRCTSDTNNTIAIKYYNAVHNHITGCLFLGFDQAIATSRLSSPKIINCLFKIDGSLRSANKATSFITLTGNSTGTGGGIHISDCEFLGSSTSNMLASCILLEESDAVYLQNCHFNRCNYAIDIAPTGATGKNKITDIKVSNCYFDGDGSPTQNIRIAGSVNTGGLYQNINFVGCLFRAALNATNGVLIDVTDAGSFYSSGLRVHNITFDSCVFKQAKDAGLVARGDNNSRLEVVGLSITDSYFSKNYSAGSTGVTDILIEADSVIVSDNRMDAATSAATFSVQIIASTAPSGESSSVVSGNDFTKSNYTSKAVNYSDISGVIVNVLDNVYAGDGQRWNEVLKVTTTDATTTTVLSENVPATTAGWIRVVVNGSSADASNYANYVFEASYNRVTAGSLAWGASDPTTVKSYKTGGVLTAPSLTKTGNIIELDVTGIAGVTFTWVVHVERMQSK